MKLLLASCLVAMSTGTFVQCRQTAIIDAPREVNDVIMNPQSVDKEGGTLRWTGTNSATSIALPPKYTLFLYGNTLLGSWNNTAHTPDDGARDCNAAFAPCSNVTNVAQGPWSSLGLYNHETNKMGYLWGPGTRSYLWNPEWNSLNANGTNRVVFWGRSMTPLYNSDEFCIFGSRLDLQDEESGGGHGHEEPRPEHVSAPFNYVENGTYVVCLSGVAKNVAAPEHWVAKWSDKIPGTGPDVPRFSPGEPNTYVYHFGDSIYADGLEQGHAHGASEMYVFGSQKPANPRDRQVQPAQILMKMTLSDIVAFKFDNLQLLAGRERGGNFAKTLDFSQASTVFLHPGSFSIYRSSNLGDAYVLLHVQEGRIYMRSSSDLAFNWRHEDLERVPSPFDDETISCHNVQIHPSLPARVFTTSPEHAETEVVSISLDCSPSSAENIGILFEPGRGVAVYLPRFFTLKIDQPLTTPPPPPPTPVPTTLPTTTVPVTLLPTVSPAPPTPQPTMVPKAEPTQKNDIKIAIVCGCSVGLLVVAYAVIKRRTLFSCSRSKKDDDEASALNSDLGKTYS